MEYLFGYGSLVDAVPGSPLGPLPRLIGYRRRFGVAMNNSRVVPGYKHYVDQTGSRPAVWVAFLDVYRSPGCEINGMLLDVDKQALQDFDARERNYIRVDVSRDVWPQQNGRVWAYVGAKAARLRLQRAHKRGAVVVSRSYLEKVREGFRAVSSVELTLFDESTDLGEFPIVDLRMVRGVHW